MPNTVYIYLARVRFMSSLLGTVFLNEFLELIYLHTVKWLQVFLSKTNNSI